MITRAPAPVPLSSQQIRLSERVKAVASKIFAQDATNIQTYFLDSDAQMGSDSDAATLITDHATLRKYIEQALTDKRDAAM